MEGNTERLLDLFSTSDTRATFFVLGWVAERHPGLVRRIVAEGHELASHGYGHEQVFAIGQERFQQDVLRAKALLEDVGGAAVWGYRAPTFSMGSSRTPWAYDVLAKAGYAYSSSIFPGRHAGVEDAELTPWRPLGGSVVEIPMTVLRLGQRSLPVSGGGPFRVTPQRLFLAALRRVNALGRRGVFYLHPWEIDPDQPRVAGMNWLQRRKHHTGLGAMLSRLKALLDPGIGLGWSRMDAVFARELGQVRPRPTLVD